MSDCSRTCVLPGQALQEGLLAHLLVNYRRLQASCIMLRPDKSSATTCFTRPNTPEPNTHSATTPSLSKSRRKQQPPVTSPTLQPHVGFASSIGLLQALAQQPPVTSSTLQPPVGFAQSATTASATLQVHYLHTSSRSCHRRSATGPRPHAAHGRWCGDSCQ